MSEHKYVVEFIPHPEVKNKCFGLLGVGSSRPSGKNNREDKLTKIKIFVTLGLIERSRNDNTGYKSYKDRGTL